MLFNSHVFIFLFLPAVWLGYLLLGRSFGSRWAQAWLVAGSLFFYGWWDARYLLLLGLSIAVNYGLGLALTRGDRSRGTRRALLGAGIALNLAAIAWFKYANFFFDTADAWLGTSFHLAKIVLPLAISFFTFQQIAYLVDAWRSQRAERDLLRYSLFVSFFPQLIAGPIVHHREMLPQFEDVARRGPSLRDVEVGLTVFFAGLYKKVVIADGVAKWSTPVFESVARGAEPGLAESWLAALSYTFQLYFDFSGYSDMAVGLGLLFGIRLPLNFASPYRSTSIIEFWRRWHMTLSRFLRDYLYVPLGGNRRGVTRRYLNLFLTMLLGGLWHGAGFTFVAWGALHGFYLLVNHAWRAIWSERGRDLAPWMRSLGRSLGRALTFVAVIFGWVLFRADHIGDARVLVEGMVGLRGLGPLSGGVEQVCVLAALAAVCLWSPNVHEVVGAERGALAPANLLRPVSDRWRWRPVPIWAAGVAVIAAWAVLGINRYSEFLYFQF